MSCPNSLPSGVSAAALAALLLAPAAGHSRESWQLVPSVSLSQGYETNPLARPDEFDQIDDFVTRINSSMALRRRTETGDAQLLVGSRARFYRDLDDLNSLDPSLRFDLSQKLTPRLEVLTAGLWSHSQSLEPIDLDGFSVHNGRPELTFWEAQGGFRYALSPVSTMRLSYRDSDADYDRTERSGLQRDQGTSELSLLYNRSLSASEQLQTSFVYQVTDFAATDPLGRIAGREQQDDTQFVGTLGYTRQFGARTSVTLTGGVRSLNSDGSGFSNARLELPDGSITNLPLDETSTAFTGGVQVTRSSRRGRLTLGFTQQTRPASGRSSSIDVQTYSANYRRRLTERVTLKLRASLSDQASASDNFVLVDATPLGCPASSLPGERDDPDGVTRSVCAVSVKSAIDEQIRYFALGLDWRVARRFTTFLSYDYLDTDSPGLTGRSYDNHRFQVGLRYSFEIDVP